MSWSSNTKWSKVVTQQTVSEENKAIKHKDTFKVKLHNYHCPFGMISYFSGDHITLLITCN